MAGSDAKDRIVYRLEKRVLNPIVLLAWDLVRNIAANPRVRVKFRSGSGVGWQAGTAHILDEDDPGERQRLLAQANLARSWCVRASAAMGNSPLTVRIDLDTR